MTPLPARIFLNAPLSLLGAGTLLGAPGLTTRSKKLLVTRALTNLIMDIYKACFEMIYIFSPTVFIDDTWTVVKKYIENEMDIKHSDEHPIYFDNFEEKDLKNIIDTQEGIIKYMKEKEYKHLYNICIIIDGWADNERVVRKNKELIKLFTKGRHWYISTTNFTSQSYTHFTGGKKECHTTILIRAS